MLNLVVQEMEWNLGSDNTIAASDLQWHRSGRRTLCVNEGEVFKVNLTKNRNSHQDAMGDCFFLTFSILGKTLEP